MTHRGVRGRQAEALDAGLCQQRLERLHEDTAVALAPRRVLRGDKRQLRQHRPKHPEHRGEHRLALQGKGQELGFGTSGDEEKLKPARAQSSGTSRSSCLPYRVDIRV